MSLRKRILYVQYTNPAGYPPLEHSSQLLAKSDWDVLFLGTGSFGSDALSIEQSARIRVHRLRFQSPGFLQKLHYLYFCFWCLFWAMRFRPAWVYASDLLACPAALLLKNLCGVPIIYHEHDAPTRRGNSRFEHLQFACRRACARSAEVCVIPNAERAKIFGAEQGVTNIVVVWNCPAAHEIGPRREPLDGQIRLLYHGTIVPERLPISVIDALAQLPDHISLSFVGYETAGARGYVTTLLNRANRHSVGSRVHYHGALSRKELLDFCLKCDVGLALLPGAEEDSNLTNLAGASNKAFEYLACGLPVIVSRLPDWERMFSQNGYGVSACSTAADLVSSIRRLCSDAHSLRAMGEAGRTRIRDEWNYETQFEPVRRLLNSTV